MPLWFNPFILILYTNVEYCSLGRVKVRKWWKVVKVVSVHGSSYAPRCALLLLVCVYVHIVCTEAQMKRQAPVL